MTFKTETNKKGNFGVIKEKFYVKNARELCQKR